MKILTPMLVLGIASQVLAQVPTQFLGFTAGWNTSYTDRCGANAFDADILTHFDNRSYKNIFLDPTDLTGATYTITGTRFVVQDQVGVTPESFQAVGYTEDPALPDFPNAAAAWFRTGAFNLPASTATGAVAWIYTITFAAPAVPKGDVWLGLNVNLLNGAWPADGCSTHIVMDANATNTSIDKPGQGANLILTNLSCNVATPIGGPNGPATYPSPGVAAQRRQIFLDVQAAVVGGQPTTQTNQTLYVCSNPGATGSTPLGGTTNMLSGLNPDLYDFNAATPARADDVGFMIRGGLMLANSPAYVVLALGPSLIGEVPVTTLLPQFGGVATRGIVCVDFINGVINSGMTDANGDFHFMVPPLSAPVRAVVQALSPIDIWWQGLVINVTTPNEAHATGCVVQHL
jgi:hypothetical protein